MTDAMDSQTTSVMRPVRMVTDGGVFGIFLLAQVAFVKV